MPKKILLAMPPTMLEVVDHIAQVESRTRSDLLREATRRYIDNFRRSQIRPVQSVPAVAPTIGIDLSDPVDSRPGVEL